MVKLKTEEDIAILKENAVLVSKTLAEVGKKVAPGVTTMELDRLAETFIRDHGAVPGFLGYGGFPYTLCLSVNDVVVHGFPSDYRLAEGDIVSVDCGTIFKGFYGDSAYTFPVGEVSEETAGLLRVTRESLERGIEKAVVGNRLGDVGFAIQSYIESFGYSAVREMVGHGIGRNMHESPEVPNYGHAGQGKKLLAGMTLCIEPMINLGTRNIFLNDNGWAIHTADGKYSAHFEKTVAILKDRTEVLTDFDYIEGKKSYN